MKMEAENLYQEAYNLHYKFKDYNGAFNGYLRTIKLYPDTNEAKYAQQQIDNINDMSICISIDMDLQDTYDIILKRKKAQKEKEEAVKLQYQEQRKNLDSEWPKKENIIGVNEEIYGKPEKTIHGCRGRHLFIFEDFVVIKTVVTLGSVITGNATDGEKAIFYKDCIGIQFKEPGMTIGYIQLETASGLMNNASSNNFNENTFTFDSNNSDIKSAYAYIFNKVRESKIGGVKAPL